MDFDTGVAVYLIHVLLDKKTPIHFNELCALIDRQFHIRLKHSGLSNLLKKFEDNFEECFENGHRFVKLITNLSICETYCSRAAHCPGGSNCTGLHICKFYLLEGKCRFGGTCKFGHDLTIAHNSRLLRENLLSGFSVDHIRYLLTLPENRTKATIPKICKFYNNAAGCRQSNSGSCPFLHMCKYYLLGKCQFSKKCSRNHTVDGNVRSILKKHGIDTNKPISELMSELRGIFTSDTLSEAEDELGTTQADAPLRWSSQPVLSTASKMKSLSLGPDQFSPLKKQTRPAVKQFQRTPSTGDLGNTSDLVCLYYLKGKCAFGKCCRNYHGQLPYQWQYRRAGEGTWQDVPTMKNWQIELTYGEPNNGEYYLPFNEETMRIDFSSMTGLLMSRDRYEVRRLSTLSSGEAIAEPHATDWLWYWKDDANEWIQYGAGTNLVKQAYSTTFTSDEIEKTYLANPEGQMKFCTEGHEYLLDFPKMVQKNVKIGTERAVRRRPVFVKELKQLKTSQLTAQSDAGIADVKVSHPPEWDIPIGRDIRDHFQLTKISARSYPREFSKVESLFFETMPNTATITSIERVENGQLWIDYCFKKARMEKKNPKGKVDERQLFHGTRPDYVDAICRQNFDFRLSGQTSGTRFGKGSYFALTAKYSDCYTDHNNRIMFMVKVLVGEYRQGHSSFVRPPSKDATNKSSELYDSCVDDEINPNIFVIFDLYQVYPEFVVKYMIKAPRYK